MEWRFVRSIDRFALAERTFSSRAGRGTHPSIEYEISFENLRSDRQSPVRWGGFIGKTREEAVPNRSSLTIKVQSNLTWSRYGDVVVGSLANEYGEKIISRECFHFQLVFDNCAVLIEHVRVVNQTVIFPPRDGGSRFA